MAPITDCLKKEELQWSATAAKAFKEIKQRMTEASVMRLPDFSKAFEVMCDASSIGIGGYSVKKSTQLPFSVKNLAELN